MIFEQVTRMIFHVTLLVSLYIVLRGTTRPEVDSPAASSPAPRSCSALFAGGTAGRTVVARLSPVVLISLGMLLAIGSGLTSLIVGRQFLETVIVHLHVPVIGEVKLVSAAVFDLGVYLLVIGVVIIVLSHLASRTHSGDAERTRRR